MKYVVKLGGAGLEVPELLQGCIRAITDLVRDGHQVAVVHGGGGEGNCVPGLYTASHRR